MRITEDTNLHLDIFIIAEDGSSAQNDVEQNAPLTPLHHHRAHPVSPDLLKAQRNFLRPTRTIIKNGLWPVVLSPNPNRNPSMKTSPKPHDITRSGLENIISSRLRSPSLPSTTLDRAIDHYKTHTNRDVNDYGELELDLSLLPIAPLIELYNTVRAPNPKQSPLPPRHFREENNQDDLNNCAGGFNLNSGSNIDPSTGITSGIDDAAHSKTGSSPTSSRGLQTGPPPTVNSPQHHQKPRPIQVQSQSPVRVGDSEASPAAAALYECFPRRRPEPDPNSERKVLYDFKSTDPATLSIIRGDAVEVVKREDKRGSGWCLVRNKTGVKGWVPISYLEPEALDEDEWW